ncbi:hypothetical protein F0L17_21965 [Streptomyces sp. TRM43335]|uniref:SalK n=1 Tax=Streptomyces taklimakanensis TaxID=2569853 RepID=A0A6G2BHK5_9ACTN|nr:hypothetical protein [Streptomyces taklimakanensis]MTE21730.1 hypothetical protein [Streptomyces taklimakanensis]
MTSLPARAGRRCHNVVNPLHSAVYFTPDLARELAPYGIEDPSAVYFAGRAASLGRVGPGVVTATFHNFHPDLVARHLPGVWDSASPETVLEARLRAADSMLRRLLGEEAVDSKEMAEAAGLALRATEACSRPGRPLYASLADLPVPQAPHLALWHAASLLREHRGDAHVAVLLHAGLDPLEALVSHTAGGRGMSPAWVLATRGWSRRDWEATQERLRGRGLLAGAPSGAELTEAGVALRKELEEETDRLDSAPYEHLGAAGTERLTELCGAFTGALLSAGAFPADAFGRG